MTITERINADIKTAMLAKDKERLEAIRAVKAALLMLQTSGEAVTDDAEIKLIQKLIKQRKESAEIYTQQNRPELAEKELSEVAFIEPYLPVQLSEEEIRTIVAKIMSETGASSIKDMGKVMAAANKEIAGRAESKVVAEIIKLSLA
ncbi:MAG: GatB/YqeY domain-containing protein [Bacteroidota bacterium]